MSILFRCPTTILFYKKLTTRYSKLVHFLAAMAELVDALDSGSSRGNSVDVRVILAAIYRYL